MSVCACLSVCLSAHAVSAVTKIRDFQIEEQDAGSQCIIVLEIRDSSLWISETVAFPSMSHKLSAVYQRMFSKRSENS